MNLWMQQHAAALVDRASLALDASLLDEACADLDAALRFDPSHAEALQMRLAVDLMQGRCDHALAVADQLAAYHPDIARSAGVALSVAEAHARGGRPAEAAETLDRALAADAEFADGWRALAGVRLRLGQTDRAAVALRRLLELEPDNATARRQLARLIGATEPQAAIDLMTWSGHGDDPVVLLDAARLCLHVDRLRDAQDLLDRVMLEHGDDPAACIEAGNLADRFGDRSGARALLEFAAATRGSHQPDALSALGVSHLHAGAFAEAVATFRRLASRARMDSDSERVAEAYAGLTVAAIAADRDRLAARSRRRLLDALNGDADAAKTAVAGVWRHAAAARIIDATRRASERADASHTPDDRNTPTLRPLLRRAVTALRRSAAEHPERADTLYQLAVCEHELGQAEAARSTLAQALRLNPDYADARRLSMRLSAMRPVDAEPVELDATEATSATLPTDLPTAA